MSNVQLNEHGLSESLESVFAQITALASVANFTISNANGSIYLQDAAQLLVTIKNLATEGERYRSEWEDLIPRTRR